MPPLRSIVTFCCLSPLLLGAGTTAVSAAPAEFSAARALLERKVQDLPGRFEIELSASQVKLPQCLEPEAFLPGNPRLSGQLTVGIHCKSEKGPTSTRYLRATLRHFAPYWVAARDLDAGTELSLDDFEQREGEISRMPGRLVVDPSQLVGQQLIRRAIRGTVWREDMARAPNLIQRNERVTVRMEGAGFTILTEGVALEDAPREHKLRIRLDSGSVIEALATGASSVTVAR